MTHKRYSDEGKKAELRPDMERRFFKLTDIKLEKREYPVDFGSPIIERTMISFKIPEDFEVEEIPENKVLMLPNKGGKFLYSVTVNAGVINVFIQFSIMQTQFVQNEYPYIREFYSQIVDKEAEQIVLKRKS